MALSYDQLKEKVLSRYGDIDSIPDSVYNAMKQYQKDGDLALDDDNVYSILISERDYTAPKQPAPIKQDGFLDKVNNTLLKEPAGDILFPRLSNSQGRPIQELTKDLLSLPGRTAYGIGAAGMDFGKGLFNYEGRVPEASEKMINEMKDYEGQGIIEGITKDPVTGALLPVSFGNLVMKAPQVLGRMGYTGAVTLADRKMTANEEDRDLTPSDYAWSAGTAILPEALRGLGKYFAKPLSDAENVASKQVAKTAQILEGETPDVADKFVKEAVKEATEAIKAPGWVSTASPAIKMIPMIGPSIEGVLSKPKTWQLASQVSKNTPLLGEGTRYLEIIASNKNKKPKEDNQYKSDLDKVWFDNKLTETEYNAYKKSENKEKFYKRFPKL